MVNKLHTQTHRDPPTHKKHQHTSQYVHVSSGSPAPSLNPVPLLHLVRDPRRHRLVALKMAKAWLMHPAISEYVFSSIFRNFSSKDFIKTHQYINEIIICH